MARVGTLRGFPHVLVVIGDDIYSRDASVSYRERLRDALWDDADSPVRKGTHDFWITYPVPAVLDENRNPVPSNFSYEDLGVEPRPLRGIIQINQLPADDSIDEYKRHLRLLFHEVGHHWLVPSDLKFRSEDDDEIELDDDLGEHIVRGERIEGIPLLGRANVHWSAYWDADASPMDGQDYERLGKENGFDHWRHAATFVPDPPLVDNFGLPFFLRGIQYNDLELALMGHIRPESAYSGGRIRWLEPFLTAPLPYQMGLFVAFSRTDFIYLGFADDHRRIIARRGGQRVHRAALGRGYEPLSVDGRNAVQFRIVRRGDLYHCQARFDTDFNAAARRSVPGLFDDLDDLPGRTRGNFDEFRTIATLRSDETPRAAGLYVMTRDTPFLAQGAFFNLELRAGGRTFRHRFDETPPKLDLNLALDDLPRGELVAHIPHDAARIEVHGGRLLITAPFATDGEGIAFKHNSRLDRMPKVLRSVPDRDFAVGTAARVRRTIITPWAGGYAAEREYWGRERSIPARNVILPERMAREREQPRNGVYKAAFIIVAPNQERAEQAIEKVDRARRNWAQAFRAAFYRNDAIASRVAQTEL